jgi:mono/diheme cytochrome c family protein
MKNWAFKILCLAIVITSSACHSVRRGEPFVGAMQLNSKQERGRVVFQQRCHQCHPNGEAGLGPALNNKPAPVFLMKTQVRLGLGAMPPFDEHFISERDLDDLMSYVMALRKADKQQPDAKSEDKK